MGKKIKRNFIIGDEWIYYKIYTGTRTADSILTDIIHPITQLLYKENIIDKWYFIRYSDPNSHIRLRLHLKILNKLDVLINLINTYLNNNPELFWKISLDTYKRELERYGNKSIEITEQLFFIESEMVTEFLLLNKGNSKKETNRWLFALKALDSLFNSFRFSLIEKKEISKQLASLFKNEYEKSKILNKQIGLKYRDNRLEIEQLLNENVRNDYDRNLLFIIKKYENELENVAKFITKLKSEGTLEVQFFNYISSCSHMLINRTFISKQKMNEMICYEFLFRYYSSTNARQNIQM